MHLKTLLPRLRGAAACYRKLVLIPGGDADESSVLPRRWWNTAGPAEILGTKGQFAMAVFSGWSF